VRSLRRCQVDADVLGRARDAADVVDVRDIARGNGPFIRGALVCGGAGNGCVAGAVRCLLRVLLDGVALQIRGILQRRRRGGGAHVAIADAQVNAVIEVAGIKDIRTKSLRSNNACNVVRATLQGLSSLRSAKEVAEVRGKSVKEILG